MPKAGADDPIRDAHAAIVQAIADLKAIGVPVPMALHRLAMLSLGPSASRRQCFLSNARGSPASDQGPA
jgi:hypothetical protein